eukprot:8893510-Alexandrium_andersonii.AAC.1
MCIRDSYKRPRRVERNELPTPEGVDAWRAAAARQCAGRPAPAAARAAAPHCPTWLEAAVY